MVALGWYAHLIFLPVQILIPPSGSYVCASRLFSRDPNYLTSLPCSIRNRHLLRNLHLMCRFPSNLGIRERQSHPIPHVFRKAQFGPSPCQRLHLINNNSSVDCTIVPRLQCCVQCVRWRGSYVSRNHECYAYCHIFGTWKEGCSGFVVQSRTMGIPA